MTTIRLQLGIGWMSSGYTCFDPTLTCEPDSGQSCLAIRSRTSYLESGFVSSFAPTQEKGKWNLQLGRILKPRIRLPGFPHHLFLLAFRLAPALNSTVGCFIHAADPTSTDLTIDSGRELNPTLRHPVTHIHTYLRRRRVPPYHIQTMTFFKNLDGIAIDSSATLAAQIRARKSENPFLDEYELDDALLHSTTTDTTTTTTDTTDTTNTSTDTSFPVRGKSKRVRMREIARAVVHPRKTRRAKRTRKQEMKDLEERERIQNIEDFLESGRHGLRWVG